MRLGSTRSIRARLSDMRGTTAQNFDDPTALRLQRLLGIPIGPVDDHGCGRGWNVELVERRLDRMVPHIDHALPDREPEPDPTRRVTVGAGFDANSENVSPPAHRDGAAR